MSDENATTTEPRMRRKASVPKAQQTKYSQELRKLQAKVDHAVRMIKKSLEAMGTDTQKALVELALETLTGEDS